MQARSATLPTVRQLLVFGPHAGAHRVALRAGLSVAIPLLALWAIGRLDLSLFATFGAFTALYGRAHGHRSRAWMQLSAAATLVVCVTLGTAVATSSARAWLVLPAAALVAAGATALSQAARWHPPGALFPVFALSACAAVPSDPARIPLAAAVAAASALLAVAIGVAGRVRARRNAAEAPRALHRAPASACAEQALAAPAPARVARASAALAPATHPAIPHPAIAREVVLAGIVTLLAGLIPTVLGLGHPYWAMVAALAAISGADTTARLVRAGQRAGGTLLGLLVAAGLLALPLSPLATIAAVIALQCAAELLVGRNYAVALVAVTPLALLMVELAHPLGSATLLHDRAIETLLGAALGAAATVLAHRAVPGRSAAPAPAAA